MVNKISGHNKYIEALFLAGVLVILSPSLAKALTITSPQTYDCGNATVGNITVKNTHDVIIKNCKIVVSSANGIQITDSYNVNINNVDINSTYPEGSGIDIASTVNGASHDITIDGFNIHGPMGWGIAGSYQILNTIVVKNGTFDGIGQAGGEQKHGMYVNNWQGTVLKPSRIEDVTIKNSWNSGLKICGATNNLVIDRVNISYSGRYGGTNYPASGPGISLGDGRSSDDIKDLTIRNSVISNNVAPAMWTTQTTKPISNMTIDHNTFYNNYYDVQIPSGGKGWVVTNNIGFNDAAWSATRVPLRLDGGEADIANNIFRNNVWYFKNGSSSKDPIGVGSSTMSIQSWKSKSGNPDATGISEDPKFVSVTSGNFHLQSGSPACSLGGTYVGAYPCNTTTATSTPTPTIKGDVNGDGKVDVIDIGILIDTYGKGVSTYPKSDVNNDGIININDVGVVIDNYGK